MSLEAHEVIIQVKASGKMLVSKIGGYHVEVGFFEVCRRSGCVLQKK